MGLRLDLSASCSHIIEVQVSVLGYILLGLLSILGACMRWSLFRQVTGGAIDKRIVGVLLGALRSGAYSTLIHGVSRRS